MAEDKRRNTKFYTNKDVQDYMKDLIKPSDMRSILMHWPAISGQADFIESVIRLKISIK